MPAVELKQDRLRLQVYIQPKASRDAIIGLHGDALKIAITAPPVDGKANQHLVKYLAKRCKVAKSQVKIIRGELGRHKLIELISPKQIPEELSPFLLT